MIGETGTVKWRKFQASILSIFDYYRPDTHKIDSFYARTLAQGQTIPQGPDKLKWRMLKRVPSFAILKDDAENDRQMIEMTGEKMPAGMKEVFRNLEEGQAP